MIKLLRIGKNPLVLNIWFKAWKKDLWDDFYHDYWRPQEVFSWRAARCKLRGQVRGIAFCPLWFK